MAQDTPYHARSISLPSRSHPLALRFDEELGKLKEWIERNPASGPPSLGALREGLRGLEGVHDAVGNLLKMPGVQKAIGGCRRERWVEEELDCSVRMLDVCGVVRESVALTSEHVRELQSALRTRRIGDRAIEEKARGYACCRRKTSKEIKNCKRMLGRTIGEGRDDRGADATRGGGDQDLGLVVRAVQEARRNTELVFDRVFATVWASGSESKGWRLTSRRHVATPRDEMGELDSLVGLLGKGKGLDGVEVGEKLRVIGDGVNGVEMGLERVFRVVINNRVALLNIVNV